MSVWQLPAWIDGRITTAGEPSVTLADVGFRSGIGVFETLRIEDSRILGLASHLGRLQVGAARLAIGADPATLPAVLTAGLTEVLTVARHGTQADLVARVTLSGGPLAASANWPPGPARGATLAITLHVAPTLPLPPAAAVLVEGRRWPADVKSTSYLASVLATREAQERGAEVGILHDGDELLEGSEGNLLLVLDGAVLTPADDGRILPGVTRELVLDVARSAGLAVLERPVRLGDIAAAQAVITTSAVQRIRMLSSLDGAPLPSDAPTVTLLRAGLTELARSAEPLPLD
jgi:branched-chain amino acid aminotransferase